MLSVTYEPFIPSVVMLSVTYEPFIPSVVKLSVIMLSALQTSYNVIAGYKFTSKIFYSTGPVDQSNTK
jgi:hypothetical protein